MVVFEVVWAFIFEKVKIQANIAQKRFMFKITKYYTPVRVFLLFKW